MKAARLHRYGSPLVVEEVPTPEIGDGEVLVKVEGAGFCHSDIHVIDGELPVLPRLPLTLGHENAGVVARVGRGVQTVKEGDPVVVYGGWGCGSCRYCVTGNEQLCIRPRWVGLSEYDGGYAEDLRGPSSSWSGSAPGRPRPSPMRRSRRIARSSGRSLTSRRTAGRWSSASAAWASSVSSC